MVRAALVALPFVLVGLAPACAMDKLGTGGRDAGPPTEAGTSAEAGTVTGGGCGAERQTGIELCIATSQCPNVVVDTTATPSCGFRVRGSVVDLVCACGTQICPMGIFTTCAEAANLLETQTESQVCLQVPEGRCVEAPTTVQNTNDGKNPACDRECMAQCGGGAACASVCNCD